MNRTNESKIAEIKAEIDRQRSLKRKIAGKAFWVRAGEKCDKTIEKLENELFSITDTYHCTKINTKHVTL